MPTAAERQALAFLAGVALLGGGARLWMQERPSGDQRAVGAHATTVDGQLNAVDAARGKKRSAKRTAKPPKKSARGTKSPAGDAPLAPVIVDVDAASAEDLERLPKVGPALAARIVANRDSLGAFGSLEALGEVRGIGPAMLRTLEPLVRFSGRPRQLRPKRR
ncbi:MAG: ComEA family DNA-binding protein [Gemmatimonas sp.]